VKLGRRMMAELKHFALEQTLQELAVTSCVVMVLQVVHLAQLGSTQNLVMQHYGHSRLSTMLRNFMCAESRSH
jgi:hypothetical protein